RGLAPMTGYFTKWLIWALYPLVLVSEFLTKRMSGHGHEQSFSRDELSAMAEMAGESGQLDAQESSMLRSLFRFRESTTSDIMTPRTVVFSLPETTTVAEYVKEHSESPFSRIPIYGKTRDDITGFVLRMEILFASVKGHEDQPLKDLCRPINAVPATVSLMNAFDSLVTKREHILLVVDEFGSVQGIVTLEDIVETLLGLEIMDEVDENKDMQEVARDLWEQRARRSGIIREGATPEDRRES
ncbi:MAG: CBS domain-containing protein, partial [Verrucomicrobiota bacterium]